MYLCISGEYVYKKNSVQTQKKHYEIIASYAFPYEVLIGPFTEKIFFVRRRIKSNRKPKYPADQVFTKIGLKH